jgi:hypothetical protein
MQALDGTLVDAELERPIAELVRQWEARGTDVNVADLTAGLAAIDRSPRDPYFIHTFAHLCRKFGHRELWQRAATTALALPHTSYRQVAARGATKLALGDWSGWVDLEARRMDPATFDTMCHYWRSIEWCRRSWDGREDLRGKTIFVIADGDASDCLPMLRYLPAISSNATQMIIGVAAPLCTFVRHNFPGDDITVTIGSTNHGLPFKRYAWLTSLPALVGTPPVFKPLTAPRLFPRATEGRSHIGLCWASGSYDGRHKGTEIPLELMMPLLERDDVVWHCLQVGGRPVTSDLYPSIRPSPVPLDTYEDAANLLAGLDGVVTVDVSVAHLAGSMGVPALVILGTGADPFWGAGDSTAWYPTLRLIRQRDPMDWQDVVQSIDPMLAQLRNMPRLQRGVGEPGGRYDRRA